MGAYTQSVGMAALVGVAVTLSIGGGEVAPVKPAPTVRGVPAAAHHAPAAFVENLGQWDPTVAFALRCGALAVAFGGRGWTLDLADPEAGRRVGLRMSFEGHHRLPTVLGEQRRPGHHDYFIGRDRARWRTGVPLYGALLYRGMYEGVDVRVRTEDGHPEYDLLLRPGADLASVRVRVDGADGLRLDARGSLVVETPVGPVTQPVPKTWQTPADGPQQAVACRYVVLGRDRFGFAADDWNRDLPLTIDPGVVWSTYVSGAAGATRIKAVHHDDSGVVTVAGQTAAWDFPTSAGAYDRSYNGGILDAVISRFDATRTGAAQLVSSTFIGGGAADAIKDVHVRSGVVTFAGWTASTDFPTTAGAFDTTYGGGAGDAMVGRLDLGQSGGAQLAFASYVGGSGGATTNGDIAEALTVDAAGVVTVVGATDSDDFPTTVGAFDTSFNSPFLHDGFVCQLDPARSGAAQLRYSSFVGGNRDEGLVDVVVDGNGVVTVGGWSNSDDYPTSAGAYARQPLSSTFVNDAVVSQIDPGLAASAQLRYSTYFGGAGIDGCEAVDVGSEGLVTAVGVTTSVDMPTTGDAFDRSYAGLFTFESDAFVCRLDPARAGAATVVYSTYLGGAGEDRPVDVGVDHRGVVTCAGWTGSSDFPTTPDSFDRSFNGASADAFVTRLVPSRVAAAQLEYSTFVGGSGGDFVESMWVDRRGDVTIAGASDSSDLPVPGGAYQPAPRSGVAGFVGYLDMLPRGVSAYGSSARWCGGAIGAGVTSRPRRGDPMFGVTSTNAPPSALGLLLVGGAAAGIPVAGVTVWVDPAGPLVTAPVVSDSGGWSRVRLRIPVGLQFVGVEVFAQFLWASPTGPAPCPLQGLASSNALRIEVIG